MLAQRVAAAPRAEAPALASSSSCGSRTRVCRLAARSRDAHRAPAAPATAALMPPRSTKGPTRSASRGLAPPRRAAARRSLAPRATSGNEEGGSGSDSAEDEADGSDDAGRDDDSMPPPQSPPPTPKATAAKKTRLEARKADRLRSQLLQMMPDPVDDPLFDAGAIRFFF